MPRHRNPARPPFLMPLLRLASSADLTLQVTANLLGVLYSAGTSGTTRASKPARAESDRLGSQRGGFGLPEGVKVVLQGDGTVSVRQ